MEKFIRIDKKGTWKGPEHRSSFATYDGTYDEQKDDENTYGYMEDGISCYKIYESDEVQAIEELYSYWVGIARWEKISDYKDMQVTIFEGNKLNSWGSDNEDLAICIKTLKEIEAVEFMSKVFNYKEKLEAYVEGYEDEEQMTKEAYAKAIKELL